MIVVIYSDMLYKRTWSNISMFSMTLYQIKFLKFYNAKCYLLEMLGMENKRGFALFLDFCGFFLANIIKKNYIFKPSFKICHKKEQSWKNFKKFTIRQKEMGILVLKLLKKIITDNIKILN